jgi:hypothetical protein
MKHLEPDVKALRQEIAEQAIGQEEVSDLHVAVAQTSDIVRRGEELLDSFFGVG